VQGVLEELDLRQECEAQGYLCKAIEEHINIVVAISLVY